MSGQGRDRRQDNIERTTLLHGSARHPLISTVAHTAPYTAQLVVRSGAYNKNITRGNRLRQRAAAACQEGLPRRLACSARA